MSPLAADLAGPMRSCRRERECREVHASSRWLRDRRWDYLLKSPTCGNASLSVDGRSNSTDHDLPPVSALIPGESQVKKEIVVGNENVKCALHARKVQPACLRGAELALL
jgi:hypothetical protein